MPNTPTPIAISAGVISQLSAYEDSVATTMPTRVKDRQSTARTTALRTSSGRRRRRRAVGIGRPPGADTSAAGAESTPPRSTLPRRTRTMRANPPNRYQIV
ncbi:hypothetical protein GCM10009639_32250 [Kitasatospora putterlickiae]|uniref:Uncharacterized protein n=1 Tax=Kitasatospora putterlickiae TaxID=221725 RepID=A0ABN1Y2T4_9ACTN